MVRNAGAYFILFLAASTSNQAVAQTAGGMMNMFTAIMRAAIVDHARVEWSKVPSNETSCIEQALGQQGYSLGVLIENGIAPTDPRVASIRFGCRTASLPPAGANTNVNTADTSNLSAKPTFDCTKARSLTARTVCADQAGAAADWDLISAYWARYFSLTQSDRQAFDQAQQNWLDGLNQTCPRAHNQRQCVLSAYHRRAAGYRAQLGGDALAESRLTPEQRAEIQQALVALGLLDDTPDGEFGLITRTAIKRFKTQSGVPEGEFLTGQERDHLLRGTTPKEMRENSSIPTTCRVMDPTGTPLNVRIAPNGGIAKTLGNGTQVHIVATRQDSRGKDWSQIERVGESEPIGWAFRDYLECGSTASQSAAAQPRQQERPTETARLKEARAFFEDSKKFIAEQKSVPSISTIANEAAALQIALDKFDELGAVQSMQRLSDLLKPLSGFDEFERQQQAIRKRGEERQLAEAKTLAAKNSFFIDDFMKDHLGDSKTVSLIKLRQQIDGSLKANSIDEISKANEAVRSYVSESGLSDAYESSSKQFANPTVPGPERPQSVLERLGINEKSKFLVEGPQDDIVLLYNASSTAPKVWKNVRGDVVFQNDAASICFAQTNMDIAVARYIEHILVAQGAKSLTSIGPPCDLSKAASSIDVIAFQRGELLKGRDDYILAMAKLVEGDAFRKYQVISDYASVFQKRQALSLEIERDVQQSERKGFGVIAVGDSPVACVITPEPRNRVDGLKELLKRNRDIIAPKFTADWQFIETNTDLAFLGLQRRQCGYVAGDANALGTIMLALRRDNVRYAFSPVWWDDKDVDQATFDVSDAREQEIRKKVGKDRALQDQRALDEERKRKNEIQKTEIERHLREANGGRARALMSNIHAYVNDLAEKRSSDNHLFPNYLNWLNGRFADQWDTYNVISDVADFGTVQWDHRPLDAIVVKTVVQQKNRILGKYEDTCFMFGLVDDAEFQMERDSFAARCNDAGTVDKWEVGESFKSQWNAK